MFAEKDPPNPVLNDNTYKTFEQFLASSNYVPKEFSALPETGTQASEDMLRELVGRIKNIDPENYKSKIQNLVEKYKDTIPKHFLEDINYFLKFGTFGSN